MIDEGLMIDDGPKIDDELTRKISIRCFETNHKINKATKHQYIIDT